MRTLLTALAVVWVAGCSTLQPATDSRPAPDSAPARVQKPTVNLAGYPPEFKQGYTDGCASAQPNAARTRNEQRFKADVQYAQGWRDGYDICQKRK
jgi:hypothetical protein